VKVIRFSICFIWTKMSTKWRNRKKNYWNSTM